MPRGTVGNNGPSALPGEVGSGRSLRDRTVAGPTSSRCVGSLCWWGPRWPSGRVRWRRARPNASAPPTARSVRPPSRSGSRRRPASSKSTASTSSCSSSRAGPRRWRPWWLVTSPSPSSVALTSPVGGWGAAEGEGHEAGRCRARARGRVGGKPSRWRAGPHLGVRAEGRPVHVVHVDEHSRLSAPARRVYEEVSVHQGAGVAGGGPERAQQKTDGKAGGGGVFLRGGGGSGRRPAPPKPTTGPAR